VKFFREYSMQAARSVWKVVGTIFLTLSLASTGAVDAAPRGKVKAFTVQREPATLVGHSGETLALRGSLRNGLGRRVWVSGSRVQIRGRALKVEEGGVLRAVPLAMAAGAKTRQITLTTLTVRLDADPGTYGGTVTVLGGRRRGDQDVLAQVPFEVTVR